MSLMLQGKRALVTGAGKGIGRGLAIAILKNGAETVAISRTQSDLDSLKAEYPEMKIVCLDISDWDLTRKTIQELGTFDLLVNNAGVSPRAEPFLEAQVEDFDSILAINVRAVFNVSQVVAKGMVEKGKGGAIVNLSSVAAKKAIKNHVFYCASKAALDSMTQTMALELGPHQIRVNSVNPTVTMTPMGERIWCSDETKMKAVLDTIPQGKFLSIQNVVDPVLYLLSDKAEMINGVFLPVDGGLLAS